MGQLSYPKSKIQKLKIQNPKSKIALWVVL